MLIAMRSRMLWLLCFLLPLGAAAQDTVETPSAGSGPLQVTGAPAKLTNDAVIRMARAGLNDNLIVQTISSQPGQYTTDADALVQLKQAGVSDRVIQAMVDKSRIRLTGAEPPVVVADVNEIGVYYKDGNGAWKVIEPEIVHEVSGGFIKSTVTQGIVKPDKNGRVNGRESKLLLPRPIEFLIYTPDGIAAAEYTLVRFRLHSDNREFRTWTGGVIHSSGGTKRDEITFTPEKIAARTYKFTLDRETPGGEYGILPPGTAGVGSLGKVYTFAISE